MTTVFADLPAAETPAYPKYKPIPRLHRDVVITEKIDGTNGLIQIEEVHLQPGDVWDHVNPAAVLVHTDHGVFAVRAGSRNRWLTPEKDNFGFGKWVWDNAEALIALGTGYHYGEWFGLGIQSGYGLDEKRFALFNVAKWYDPRDEDIDDEYRALFPKAKPAPELVTVVPVLTVLDGRELNDGVDEMLHTLESEGSVIAPGFMNPEGVVVFHAAAVVLFKATIHNDEKPKSQVKKNK